MADVGREGKDTLFLTSNLSPSSPFPSSSSATTATSGSALGLLIGGGSGGGGSASGSIRELKNGITVKVDASSTDFTGVTGIFPIRYLHPDSRSSRQRRLGFIDVNEIDDEGDSQDDTFLAVSFIGETKIMYLNQEDRDTATKVNRNSYNGGGSGSAAGALLEDVSDRFGIIMGEESLLVCSMIISSSSESLASSSSSSKNTTSIMEDSNYDDIKLDDLTPSTAISSSASPPPAPFTMAVAQICRSGIFFTRQHFDETTPTTSSILQQQPRGVDYEYDHGDIVGEYKPLHGGRIELVALETDNTRLFISVNNSNNTNPSLTSSSSPYQIIIVKLAHQQHQPHLVNTLEDGIERPSLSSSSCGSSISGGRVDVIELMRLDCLNEPSAFLPLPKYLISSLSSRQEGDSDVLVVGTYASTIHVVRCLDGGVLYDGTILQKDGSANNTTAAAAAEFLDQGTDIVHSLCQITSTGGIGNAEEDNGADGCGVMFLAGLRDGIVRLYQWSNMDQRLVCLDSMKLGCLPVQFTAPHPLNRHQREPASPLPPSYLLAFSDRSWKLIIRHHTITAIALNFPPVHLAAPFSFNSTHHHSKSTLKMSSAHYCDTFMFVANDHLHFVRVNLDKTLDFRIKLIHEVDKCRGGWR